MEFLVRGIQHFNEPGVLPAHYGRAIAAAASTLAACPIFAFAYSRP